MAPEEQTSEEQVQEPVAEKKPVSTAKKTKLICKGPAEVSIHLIDESLDLTANDGKVGAGSVKGKILTPGEFVDIKEVPDYQISDEIKDGTHAGLELVTAQEASVYRPKHEGDIVSGGMEIPRNNHMARPVPSPQ